MATVASTQGAQQQQQRLHARREKIVLELDRINREIDEAERQLARVDAMSSGFAQQSGRVAA